LKKDASGIIVTLLFIGMSTLTFNIQLAKTNHTTITVPDNYSTIQEAINNANEGDTIFVRNKTYNENIIVNKTVSLIGENKETTIINGSSPGNVIEVTAGNVTITNFTIKNSGIGWPISGILLNHAQNCNISGNKLTNNNNGIRLSDSSNNTISGNNVTNNNVGIAAWDFSKNNNISRNYVANNSPGIWLFESSDNSLYGNEITNNDYGIRVCSCASNNKIYHNNVMNNTDQVYGWNSTNTWDNGYPYGGNYWSDYAGIDLHGGPQQNETGSDGIGDTPHTDIDAQDKYPLMGPINFFNAGTWNQTTYYINTVSNSTVSDFHFNEVNKLVSFNITRPDDTISFCRITIPKKLLWCDHPEEWQVWVNITLIENRKIMEDTSYTYVYFICNHTTQNVEAIGVHVIPEFPLWTPILLILIILTVATAITKRRLPKIPIFA
jgi:parallel beta-helix repeat protein